ncbi:MAG: sulfite exporter TauE/SafE family protein [Dehalococcoidia bacterium]|nr:sulfite exporter TauE/SafE family protein [Dehalococcoidia bacterium]
MDGLLLALMPILGFVAGSIGALIGAGGGFIAVPILLFVLPNETAGTVTGISQSMVLMTSLSSTVAYVRQKRIEYRWAAVMAVAGIPGMAIGAFIVEQLERGAFEIAFGVVALSLMIYLIIRPIRGRGAARTLQDAEGARVPLTTRRAIPLAVVGFGTATMGGLLGVGGGIAMVPIIVQVFVFPAHLATATSQLVILITSPAAIIAHEASAPLHEMIVPIILLGIGAIVGAQVGARVSRRVSAPWIVRILGIGLGIVGVDLIYNGLIDSGVTIF